MFGMIVVLVRIGKFYLFGLINLVIDVEWAVMWSCWFIAVMLFFLGWCVCQLDFNGVIGVFVGKLFLFGNVGEGGDFIEIFIVGGVMLVVKLVVGYCR